MNIWIYDFQNLFHKFHFANLICLTNNKTGTIVENCCQNVQTIRNFNIKGKYGKVNDKKC